MLTISLEVVNMDCNKDKEKQVDNLINLVENHTRTQRHLEQYSHIGDPDNTENARDKQEVREEQIDILKDKIVGNDTNTETKEEQMSNLLDNYISSEGYIQKNQDHMSKEMIQNMQKKQENRQEQLDNLKNNIE